MSPHKKKSKKAENLAMESKNGWLSVSPAEKKKIEEFAQEYLGFMTTAKTEREANDAGLSLAEAQGYQNLQDYIDNETPLKVGDKVYFSAAGKTLILARIGKQPMINGLRIIGGHTDAPRLDLKPRPIYEDSELVLLDTHYYGGVKKYQWVAMPLALHGVVIKSNGERVDICIGEDLTDPVFTITDLLPHLGKEQAKKPLSTAITGEGLNVLCGSIPSDDKDATSKVKDNILTLLNRKYGICEADFISAELELVPAGCAREVGFDRSMILAYGQDDRVCAYTGLRAMLDRKAVTEYTSMCILCDKEEIGSYGATGMNGYLFENVVAEMVNLQEKDYNDIKLRRCLKKSKLLSADVNVLHDPNYPDVSSPNSNNAKMNYGVVVAKYTGSGGKGGANDANAEFMAEIRRIFDKNKVLWQVGELGKVDEGGGGTISWMLARYEMDTVDCGPGVLSMHAPWELTAKLDVYMAYKAYTAFYASR